MVPPLPARLTTSSAQFPSLLPSDATGPVPRRVLGVAHRGASTEHRENTLHAFARALELGADGIELDVHVTRDEQVVVHHDAHVHRWPGGPVVAIRDLVLSEIRAFDLGEGTRVPTLDEVMELVAGRAEVFVELKRPVYEEQVVACVVRHRAPYALHSFDHDAIERVAARAPQLRRGLLFDDSLVDPIIAIAARLERTNAHDLWPRFDHVTASLVGAAHALGMRVIPWTVNDAATGRDLIALGVDGICTDDVRWLRIPDATSPGSPPVAHSSTFAPPPMHI